MTDSEDEELNNVIELYKLRICAALDAMPIDQVRALVAEIEAKLDDEKRT
jgi:hypothetical protein